VGKLAGLMYVDVAVDRLKATDPGAHVVAVLREPVARAYSAFWHARTRGREPLERFEDALDGDPARFADDNSRRVCSYLEWSDYATAIARLHAAFPPEQVHVMFLDELTADPLGRAAPLLAPFGLDADGLPNALPASNPARAVRAARVGASQRRRWLRRVARGLPVGTRERLRRGVRRLAEVPQAPPPIDPVTSERLHEHFEASNARLVELLGRPLPDRW
jgi:hypothetical protein